MRGEEGDDDDAGRGGGGGFAGRRQKIDKASGEMNLGGGGFGGVWGPRSTFTKDFTP